MKNISLDLSGKVDQPIVDLLREIDKITKSLGIRFFVIGATARDIIMETGYGIPSGRKTKDVDFAMMVEDWPAYDQLKSELLSTGNIVENKKISHRFQFKGILDLDILPFGDIENPIGSIKWPQDRSLMKVLGFREAMETAITVQVEPELQVLFASPAGMAVLKLISWSDRRHVFPEKDISDLALVLTKYAELGNEDRLFDEDTDLMKEEDSEMDFAGARLLGRDMGKMISPETRTEILKILDQYANRELGDSLIVGLMNQLPGRDYARAKTFLEKLKVGIDEVK